MLKINPNFLSSRLRAFGNFFGDLGGYVLWQSSGYRIMRMGLIGYSSSREMNTCLVANYLKLHHRNIRYPPTNIANSCKKIVLGEGMLHDSSLYAHRFPLILLSPIRKAALRLWHCRTHWEDQFMFMSFRSVAIQKINILNNFNYVEWRVLDPRSTIETILFTY